MSNPATIDIERTESTTTRSRRAARRPIQVKPNSDYQSLLCHLQSVGYCAASERRMIGLTSSLRREGVTTVCRNLAQQASLCDSLRVLMVDANISHPSLHKSFRIPPTPGLSTLMAREATVRECIVKTPINNLWMVPAGKNENFGGCNFAAREVLDFLNSIRDNFDLIVVDLPALSVPTNLAALMNGLDGMLFVLEAERTPAERAKRSLKQLRDTGADLLGVVFNRSKRYFPDWLFRREA